MDKRAAADHWHQALESQIADAEGSARARLFVELADLKTTLWAEKISEVAAAFDGVNNIHRAVEVGSVDAVIDPCDIRPRIIAEIERRLS